MSSTGQNELIAWLGPARNEMTIVQLEEFMVAVNAYYDLPLHERRDPEERFADQAEDDAAMSAILQSILKEDSLAAAAHRAREAQDALDGWIRASAALGVPESTIASVTGLHRKTIRTRIGK